MVWTSLSNPWLFSQALPQHLSEQSTPEERLDKSNLGSSNWPFPRPPTSDILGWGPESVPLTLSPAHHSFHLPSNPPTHSHPPIHASSFQLHGPPHLFSPPLMCHPSIYAPTYPAHPHPPLPPSIHPPSTLLSTVPPISLGICPSTHPPEHLLNLRPLTSSTLPHIPSSHGPLCIVHAQPHITSFPPSICPLSIHPSPLSIHPPIHLSSRPAAATPRLLEEAES